MDIPAKEWNAAIAVRRSRRQYGSVNLDAETIDHIRDICHSFRPFPTARAELVTRAADSVLGGVKGSYGIIKGATAFVAFIGDMDDPEIQQKVGYTGEGVILEATSRGLATCWVAGSFRRKTASAIVQLSSNERIIAVSPIGHAPDGYTLGERMLPAIVRARKRKPLSELTSGLAETEWPQWMKSALEAARLAPSAYNRQPWRFRLEPDSITVSAVELKRDFGFSVHLDCGIAMLHIEVATADCGMHGDWEPLESPQVARFTAIGDPTKR